jgi:ribosomal protein S10
MEEIVRLLFLLAELSGETSFHHFLERKRILPLPTLRKEFTVLKSPHIDKKSREQFSWSRRKSQLCLSLREKKYADLLLLFLKNCEFPGVELKISRVYSSSL